MMLEQRMEEDGGGRESGRDHKRDKGRKGRSKGVKESDGGREG